MIQPLCPLPFTHLFINNAGIVNACCLTYPQYSKTDEFGLNLEDRSVLKVGLAGAVKSSHLRLMQKLVSEQQWPKSCATCKSHESSGHKSRRQTELETSVASSPGIRTMDLRVGNVCNLACRMCSPFSSVALLEEWSDADHPNSKVMEESIGAYRKISWQNWSETPEVWNDLFEISEHVTENNFAGGEPFLNVAHVNYLKKLIFSGRSQNIRISYNTNLTVIPNWLEPIIENFSRVKIMVSVDGVGALGEFIRHPLKWNSFEQNLVKLDWLKESSKEKLEIAFNTTVQAYNVFGLTELLDYFANSSLKNLPRTSTANLLENPSYFNVANLPSKLKEEARRKIDDYLAKPEHQKHMDFLTAVTKQLNISTPTEIETNSVKEFRSVTTFSDKKRRQNFAKIVPEMSSILKSEL